MLEGAKKATDTGAFGDFRYRLIGKIYETARNPELWPSVLAELATLLGGNRAILFHHDSAAKTGSIVHAHNVAPPTRRAYAEFFACQNPWVVEPVCARKPGQAVAGESLVPRSKLMGSAFYESFLKPLGIEYSLHATIASTGKGQLHLVIGRPEATGAPHVEEVEVFQIFVDHICRAGQVQLVQARQSLVERGANRALNLLAVGFAMIDRDGHILDMNESLRKMVDSDDGLRTSRDGLEAMSEGKYERLATLCAIHSGMSPVSGYSIARPSGRRPYSLLIYPFSRPAEDQEKGSAGALLFVSDPEQTAPDYGEELVQHVYSLTPAEARVAVMLAQGYRVNDISEVLRISIHTARTHLKRIFEKTGVDRQAELVHLLYGLLAMIQPEPGTQRFNGPRQEAQTSTQPHPPAG